MAETNTTAASDSDIHPSNPALDLQDEISKRIAQAAGIVDLLGAVDAGGVDDASRGNAAWIAKDLLREVGQLVLRLGDMLPLQITAPSETGHPDCAKS